MADEIADIPLQTRIASFTSEIDLEKREVRMSFSSDTPCLRRLGPEGADEMVYEILSHKPDSIDVSRLAARAVPFLDNHNRQKPLGKIIDYGFSNGRGYALARLSRSPEGEQALRDIQDQIRTEISVGYAVQSVEPNGYFEGKRQFTVSRWTPYEISLTDVPLDFSIGIGREAEELALRAEDGDDHYSQYGDVTYADTKNHKYPIDTKAHAKAAWSYINMPKNAAKYSSSELSTIKGRIKAAAKKFGIEISDDDRGIDSLEVTERASVFTGNLMPETVSPSQQHHITTVETPTNQAQLDNIARDSERTRVREILGLGERHGFPKQALDYLDNGKSPADFRAFILDEQLRSAEKTAIGSNPLGMSPREIRTYSLTKAIRENVERQMGSGQGVSGLEREASDGLAKILGRAPSGFFVPDVALMPLSRETILAQRDLSAGIAASGGVTIELAVEPTLIQYLRNKTFMGRMGATMMGGLTSNISLPRQTGAGQAYWLAENAPVSAASQTFDQVGLSPKRLAAQTAYSKQLVAQSSLDIENIVRDDILQVIAIAQDAAALQGTGIGNNQPMGLLNYTANTAGTYNYANRAPDITFGGAATWLSAIQFEANVEDGNVDLDDSSGYVTTPLVKAKWKGLTKAVNYPVYLWEKASPGSPDGEVNGYKALATKQVPNNRVIFGKWRDSIIATWSGIDMITDPLTLAGSFQIKVTVNLLTDINFRYVMSFCASTDAGNQ